ncbi:transposase [Streptomyces parvus]|nr:transposase [Streptomyces parvus]MCQ1580602.1 transposase [Streptomyces parvus]
MGDLALAPEHRRGHGALYGGLNQGRIYVARLRRALAGVPLPRAADGRLMLAVDVSPWLRPDTNTFADRAFCHTFGQGEGKHQMVPGWPHSVVAARPGRRCWTRSAWSRPLRSPGRALRAFDPAALPAGSAPLPRRDRPTRRGGAPRHPGTPGPVAPTAPAPTRPQCARTPSSWPRLCSWW